MRTSLRTLSLFTIAAAILVLAPPPAEAYIGPGVGITAIGTVVAFIGAILFAIVGFIWYPMKRLLRAVRGRNVQRNQPEKASLT